MPKKKRLPPSLEPPGEDVPQSAREWWFAGHPGRAWRQREWARSIAEGDPRAPLARKVEAEVEEIFHLYRIGAADRANARVERLEAVRGQALALELLAKLDPIYRGYESRRDRIERQEVRDLAAGHWRKFPDDPVAAVVRDNEGIQPFTHRYTERTLRDWIKDLKPGGTRRGRPRKR